jgi:hypothetical protein
MKKSFVTPQPAAKSGVEALDTVAIEAAGFA